ncbi:E3 SUMO-protein ligase ZBED1-like [Ornithodoros turicata]|uniref:E3 SUMO-protein ligase ZBED1-like n=1 Tax=Ornithodoros turicata TaxID=34597 RepID=UPI003138EF08
MIALDLQPYSIVQDRGFQELLAEAVPHYEPPSRTTLSWTLIPRLYHETRSKVQAELDAALGDGVESMSFTSDMWTSQANDSYISLTCHFTDANFTVKRYSLDTSLFSGRHTAAQIAEVLDNLVQSWNIPDDEFPVYIVTDNARNFRAAARELPWIERPCFAHSLQLAIQTVKEQTPVLGTLLRKARAIVGHYKHSPQAQERLDNYQKKTWNTPLHLIQDVETRWNSEYNMLSTLLELRGPVTVDMANSECIVDCFTGAEWRLAADYVQVLKPLAQATTEAEGEKYPTLSCQVPTLYCIIQSLRTTCRTKMTADGCAFAANVEKSLRTRFPDYDMDKDACVAMFCDPRYKLVVFHEDSAREEWLKSVVLKEMGQHVATNMEFEVERTETAVACSLWSAFDRVVETQHKKFDPSSEFHLYSTESAVTRGSDPCKWWNEVCQHKFPILGKLARKYLGIPATSASSERAFSVAGNVATPRRASLLPSHVQQLTFLHDNLRL